MTAKLISAALAATILITASAPADAQRRWDRDRYRRDRDNGIDAGDVIGGLLAVGAVAGIAAALTKNKGGSGDTYRNERRAIDACVDEAEGTSRYGSVRVTDVTDVQRQDGYYYVSGYMDVAGSASDTAVGFTCTTRSGTIYDFQRSDGYHW